MAKAKEELNPLKQEHDALTNKPEELPEEELKQVTGGKAPELPATTLAEDSYKYIFEHGEDFKEKIPKQTDVGHYDIYWFVDD